jgi:hypothetical protein
VVCKSKKACHWIRKEKIEMVIIGIQVYFTDLHERLGGRLFPREMEFSLL